MSSSTHRLTIEDLDIEHRGTLDRAIKNLLSTDLALTTYAQVLDGLPLSDVAWDRTSHKLHPQHPINSHDELCPGVLESARSLRDDFDVCSLHFDNKVSSWNPMTDGGIPR